MKISYVDGSVDTSGVGGWDGVWVGTADLVRLDLLWLASEWTESGILPHNFPVEKSPKFISVKLEHVILGRPTLNFVILKAIGTLLSIKCSSILVPSKKIFKTPSSDLWMISFLTYSTLKSSNFVKSPLDRNFEGFFAPIKIKISEKINLIFCEMTRLECFSWAFHQPVSIMLFSE